MDMEKRKVDDVESIQDEPGRVLEYGDKEAWFIVGGFLSPFILMFVLYQWFQ